MHMLDAASRSDEILILELGRFFEDVWSWGPVGEGLGLVAMTGRGSFEEVGWMGICMGGLETSASAVVSPMDWETALAVRALATETCSCTCTCATTTKLGNKHLAMVTGGLIFFWRHEVLTWLGSTILLHVLQNFIPRAAALFFCFSRHVAWQSNLEAILMKKMQTAVSDRNQWQESVNFLF